VATAGRVKDAPNESWKAAMDRAVVQRLSAAPMNAGARSEVTTRASVLVGIEYTEPNFNRYREGDELVIAARSGCDADAVAEHQRGDLPSYGWNDIISSYRAYNGCQAQHYRDIWFNGPRMVPKNSLATMGSYDNWASSIRWR